jgi:hypothetical protein
MSKQRYTIQVRQYHTDGTFTLTATIQRKPWAEQIGNFNPLFCRYQGRRCLIESDEGDVSDPFRREESYANSFYIQPRDGQGKRVITEPVKQAA